MVVMISIVAGALLALFYSRSGMFVACLALISVFLSTLTALAVSPTVVHLVGYESPHALAATLAAVALFAFVIIRGALAFVNADVDFHPLVERLGGGLAGFGTGLFAVGFASVCLLCLPREAQLDTSRQSTAQASDLILSPARQIADLLHMDGPNPLQVDRLLLAAGPRFSPYTPPAAPAPEAEEASSENPGDDTAEPPSGRR